MHPIHQLIKLPALEHIINRFPLIITPETLVVDVIALMSQTLGSNCSLPSLKASSLQASNLNQIDHERKSCALVVDGLRLVGIFTERDVVKLAASCMNLSSVTVGEVMTQPVISLNLSQNIHTLTALSILRQHNIRHLPILDDKEQLLGIITPGSIRQVLQPTNLLKIRDVSEVLTTQVVHTLGSTSLLELAQIMTERQVSCVVIVEEDDAPYHPIGIITERDIVQFKVLELDLAHTKAGVVMSTPLFCLHPKDSLWFAHQKMLQYYVRRLVVTADSGELLGIVTQSSFLEFLNPIEISGLVMTLQQQVEEQTAELQQVNQELQQEISKRQQIETALRQSYDELERRVKERTAEITQANLLLQQEISERRIAESALHNIKAALESAVEGISQLDSQGLYLSVNSSYANIVGYKPEEMIGMEWQKTIHPDDELKMLGAYQQMLAIGKVEVEARGIRKDGSSFYKQLVMVKAYNQEQQFIGHYCFCKDISERKLAEAKIREQAALLDVATNAILVRGLDSNIFYWNKGAERLYGWSSEEVIGKNANRILYKNAEQLPSEALFNVVEFNSWQGELNKVTKDGKNIIVDSHWTLVRDEAGEPKFILTVDADITDKKQIETQFLRTQRLQSLGTLASGIAHDFNNILTPILAIAQLLPLKLPNADEQTHLLVKMLEESTKRGADLVKQILSFARGAEGKRTVMQIRHLIKEVADITKSTFPKSIEINTILSTKDLWVICADATQLHQVLMNLCVNARDAMPNGGTLTIKAENRYIDEAYARMNEEGGTSTYVVITIADTGVGIPEEIQEQIFDPFFTTKEVGRGTGLGLSTVLGIIKNHNGFVKVYSELGKGTQFKIYLPAVAGKEIAFTEDVKLPKGNGETILVVDDDSAVREIIQASLDNYNYNTLSAADGVEAIAFYAQNKKLISVVLIDIMMPSMDGLTAIRTLKKINPQVRIIATSGLISNKNLVAAANIGVDNFLSKPYSIKELLDAVSDVLKHKM
jgi:PAS domain S-box-containing protein